MKAVSYLRTSSMTNVNGDKDSRHRQDAVIDAYADRNGYTIVQSAFDPGRSGADPINDRDGFSALLDFCKDNLISTILIETSSRYARDKDVAVRGFYLMEDYGIDTLIDCNEDLDLLGLWFSGKPYEALYPFLKMIISAEEKKEIVRRLKSARDRVKAQTGKCSGRKSLVQIYGKDIRVLALRSRRRGGSYRDTARLLAKRGFTRANGLPLSPSQVWDLINKPTLKIKESK